MVNDLCLFWTLGIIWYRLWMIMDYRYQSLADIVGLSLHRFQCQFLSDANVFHRFPVVQTVNSSLGDSSAPAVSSGQEGGAMAFHLPYKKKKKHQFWAYVWDKSSPGNILVIHNIQPSNYHIYICTYLSIINPSSNSSSNYGEIINPQYWFSWLNHHEAT